MTVRLSSPTLPAWLHAALLAVLPGVLFAAMDPAAKAEGERSSPADSPGGCCSPRLFDLLTMERRPAPSPP